MEASPNIARFQKVIALSDEQIMQHINDINMRENRDDDIKALCDIKDFSPLSDDGDVFKLMTAHIVVKDFEYYDFLGEHYACAFKKNTEVFLASDHGHNKAVCLAVIHQKGEL